MRRNPFEFPDKIAHEEPSRAPASASGLKQLGRVAKAVMAGVNHAPLPAEPASVATPIAAGLGLREKIVLKIPGRPQPGGSKRAFMPKGAKFPVVVDANPNVVDWKRTVQFFAAQKQLPGLLNGPISASFMFHLPRPQSHVGARGKIRPSAPKYPATTPDLLKLARSTEDALTGLIWTDDCRVVTEVLHKIYTSDGWTGVVIEIEELI